MATINKTMKTFNVPNGNNVVCYEVLDDKGRKAIAKDWATHSSEAFVVGEYTMKDGVVYRFKSNHAENTAWNAGEVEATNLGAEIFSIYNALQGIGLGIENGVLAIDPVTE